MRPFVCLVLALSVGTISADDSKKEEAAKENQARSQAKAIETAVKQYYVEKLEWPAKLADVAVFLENGKKDLIDPWGTEYQFGIENVEQDEGVQLERPFVWTQRNLDGKVLTYGKRPEKKNREDIDSWHGFGVGSWIIWSDSLTRDGQTKTTREKQTLFKLDDFQGNWKQVREEGNKPGIFDGKESKKTSHQRLRS
jgi:hypothetical protein